MHLSTDDLILWQYGFIKFNLTIAITWVIMGLLTIGSYLITRKLLVNHNRSRWQNVFEMVMITIETQMAELGLSPSRKYLGFLATLFLFVVTANLLTIIPGYEPPTGSLSTTTALALCVFVAAPLFGIKDQGLKGYLKTYLEPTIMMLPFNIIGEFSRTLALAVRLFGNMMSGTMILAILLIISPFIFPILMSLLGLLTGMVQAYIFTILAMVYIAAAIRIKESPPDETSGTH